MKKLALLILCLLLCGCRQELPEAAPVTEAAVPTESNLERSHPLSGEGLAVYPLTQRKVRAVRAMGEDLLVFSGYGSTTLSLLSGEDLELTAQQTLAFELDPKDPALRIGDMSLSFFDPDAQETVVWNRELKEISRIPAPAGATGSPILSDNRENLFYAGGEGLMVWELNSGFQRKLKLQSRDQQLTGLHFDGTLLQYQVLDGDQLRTFFMTESSGQDIYASEGVVTMVTQGQEYFAQVPVGSMELLIYGDREGQPRMLCPEDLGAKLWCLPQVGGAVTVSTANREDVCLAFYDLDTGHRRGQLILDALYQPKSIAAVQGDSCYLLVYDPERDCDMILQWQLPQTAEESTCYTYPYVSNDAAALAQCRSYADRLEQTYGLEIILGEDALAVQPWDYEFQPEILAPVLMRELEQLEVRLEIFPEGMLEQTSAHFASLNLCLVRQIRGTAASGSLDMATGVQFFEENHAYVAIAAGKYSAQALYHELFHIMETHILNESIAFDQWEGLNPAEFDYVWGYGIPEEYDRYLSSAFLDRYSMSYPKEDRARIWETAILAGNRDLFQSPILQSKLEKLCQGIREAYGLKKSPETFLWEQYLD